jgi:hypothetical protein
MIRNDFPMYFDRRRLLRKPLLIAAALVAGMVAPVGASAAGSGQVVAVSGRAAASSGQIARAGENVAGLTLTTAQAPSPLPTTLPAGHPYQPPAGKIFQGVADKPVSAYTQTVGKHPAVYQEFVGWGQWLPTITQDAKTNRARLMMMVSTQFGSKNMISPDGIATGAGDQWLIGLAQQLYASGNITYLRLMAEMNNCNNAYAANNCDGSSRGPQYSSAEFKQAWRRVALIMRGGVVALIDKQLAALDLPALRTSMKYLPTPKVAMVWVPMVGGSPDIPALEPSAYFPGRRWIDWVGTDFYSRYPNWTGLSSFYAAYAHLAPFAFGEYAIWDGDNPGWAHTLFSWVSAHPRTQMMVYNDASPDFWLSHFPASAATIRSALASPKFLAYAPEWAPGG